MSSGFVATALQKKPIQLILAGYAIFFLLFVSLLFGFHSMLISSFKTTQEKLKADKGEATGKYRANPYMYSSFCLNWRRSLCCRRRPYNSKITWELYLYSLGFTEKLKEFWES
jgi:hypothetical protein